LSPRQHSQRPAAALTWCAATAVIGIGALLLAGCPQRVARPAPPAAPPAPTPVLPLVGHFTGVLPCADCRAVEIELMLRADWSGTYRYQLRETRVAADGGRHTLDAQGTWRRTRGTAVDAEAVVYQLDTDRPDAPRLFVVLDEWRIRAVDANGAVPQPPGDYVLTRIDRRGPAADQHDP
jgi:hypothetical protein